MPYELLPSASLDQRFDEPGWEDAGRVKARSAPSLAIVLISVACGLAASVFGLHLAYAILRLSVQWSAAIATLSLLAALSGSAAWLVSLSGSHNTTATIGFGCAAIALLLAFVGGCALAAGLLASFVWVWR